MKVSEITTAIIAEYIREDFTSLTVSEKANLTAILTAVKAYITGYTGIPETSTDLTVKTLDDYEDFYIVILILAQDMYDNRVLYIDNKSLNRTVSTILDMHCRNLLPTPEV